MIHGKGITNSYFRFYILILEKLIHNDVELHCSILQETLSGMNHRLSMVCSLLSFLKGKKYDYEITFLSIHTYIHANIHSMDKQHSQKDKRM
jgi:hypothetical protein